MQSAAAVVCCQAQTAAGTARGVIRVLLCYLPLIDMMGSSFLPLLPPTSMQCKNVLHVLLLPTAQLSGG